MCKNFEEIVPIGTWHNFSKNKCQNQKKVPKRHKYCEHGNTADDYNCLIGNPIAHVNELLLCAGTDLFETRKMTDIDLGFAEESDGKWLTNAHFPNKIGGKPAWLHLGELPSAETLKCQKCGLPKSFLCQVYAPFDDEYNFHRMVYIFVCRTESCYTANDNGPITVLRSQLPVKNDYYPDEPPSDGGEPVPEIQPPTLKLCAACGCLGHLKCSRCKQINYCGAAHQRQHWKYHKLYCSEGSAISIQKFEPLMEIVFPEWEICMNADDDSVGDKSEEPSAKGEIDEQQQLQELEKLISSGKAGDFRNLPETELEKYTKGSEEVDDKHFRSFRKECAREPTQIVRYKRSGQPLWISDIEKTVKDAVENVPACDLCGTARQYEFQIMPQMLNYLKDPIVDWGVLAIYTCPNSCPLPENKGYTQEFVIKQDILSGSQ